MAGGFFGGSKAVLEDLEDILSGPQPSLSSPHPGPKPLDLLAPLLSDDSDADDSCSDKSTSTRMDTHSADEQDGAAHGRLHHHASVTSPRTSGATVGSSWAATSWLPTLPTVSLPSVSFPSVSLPSVSLEAMSLPLPSTLRLGPTELGVLAASAVGATAGGAIAGPWGLYLGSKISALAAASGAGLSGYAALLASRAQTSMDHSGSSQMLDADSTPLVSDGRSPSDVAALPPPAIAAAAAAAGPAVGLTAAWPAIPSLMPSLSWPFGSCSLVGAAHTEMGVHRQPLLEGEMPEYLPGDAMGRLPVPPSQPELQRPL